MADCRTNKFCDTLRSQVQLSGAVPRLMPPHPFTVCKLTDTAGVGMAAVRFDLPRRLIHELQVRTFSPANVVALRYQDSPAKEQAAA